MNLFQPDTYATAGSASIGSAFDKPPPKGGLAGVKRKEVVKEVRDVIIITNAQFCLKLFPL